MANSSARRAAEAAARAVFRDNAQLSSFRITKFGRHRDGYFHAEVSLNGDPAYVSCKWGSWLIPRDPGGHSGREVIPPFNAVLADRMRDFEADERRARKHKKEEIVETAVDAKSATRLLVLIGYSDEEIAEAIQVKFQMTAKRAASLVTHVHEHLATQEQQV